MKKMHYSVLLNEVIDNLNIKDDGIYVDCTLGYGGHSSEILKRIKKGHLFAFDQDKIAIENADLRLKKIGENYTIIKSNFKAIKDMLAIQNINEVDGIVFDLGVSSPQLDEDYRGFSFHKDAKLDMRMDLDSDFSAYHVVNEYNEDELARIIFKYGEEKYAKSIAKNIVKKRKDKPIETTFELVDIIRSSMPAKEINKKHPGRKTFQAIRIEVNHELDILESSLKDSLDLLKIGGRLAVISFHSLEDRIVKKLFKEVCDINPLVKGLPNIPEEYLPNYKLVVNGGIKATEKELEKNSRSRSATLRIIEKIK